ncbi:hypothetical protein P4V96_21750, partial [Bacillus thuringiensis]|nr:hypothetical protein [Bacillus thuringiensis]
MSCDSERAASAFNDIQLQRLEQSVVSLLHLRKKAPRNQEFQHPPVLNEPLALIIVPHQRLKQSVISLLNYSHNAP